MKPGDFVEVVQDNDYVGQKANHQCLGTVVRLTPKQIVVLCRPRGGTEGNRLERFWTRNMDAVGHAYEPRQRRYVRLAIRKHLTGEILRLDHLRNITRHDDKQTAVYTERIAHLQHQLGAIGVDAARTASGSAEEDNQ